MFRSQNVQQQSEKKIVTLFFKFLRRLNLQIIRIHYLIIDSDDPREVRNNFLPNQKKKSC